MLYPIENEIRQVKNLCGIWKFKRESRLKQGFDEKWYQKPLSEYSEMFYGENIHANENEFISLFNTNITPPNIPNSSTTNAYIKSL